MEVGGRVHMACHGQEQVAAACAHLPSAMAWPEVRCALQRSKALRACTGMRSMACHAVMVPGLLHDLAACSASPSAGRMPGVDSISSLATAAAQPEAVPLGETLCVRGVCARDAVSIIIRDTVRARARVWSATTNDHAAAEHITWPGPALCAMRLVRFLHKVEQMQPSRRADMQGTGAGFMHCALHEHARCCQSLLPSQAKRQPSSPVVHEATGMPPSYAPRLHKRAGGRAGVRAGMHG